MIFTETALPGAFEIELKLLEDERGFFARTFCQQEFLDHGLSPVVAQCNLAFNWRKGTVRGMHLQLAPHAEDKLVRVVKGSIYDVIIDLRPSSPTYLQWIGVELTAQNRKALYVPKGFAHGYQSLEDETEVFYQMSEFYAPEAAIGYRWNDPAFQVKWPLDITSISSKDQSYPDYEPQGPIDPATMAGLTPLRTADEKTAKNL